MDTNTHNDPPNVKVEHKDGQVIVTANNQAPVYFATQEEADVFLGQFRQDHPNADIGNRPDETEPRRPLPDATDTTPTAKGKNPPKNIAKPTNKG